MQTVRVFISSTFADMSVERAALAERVFPQLHPICKDNGVLLLDIDLRWGVETAGASVAEIVRSELNRSEIVISLLGGRFGYVPEGEYDSSSALEVYAAIANPAIQLLAFHRLTPSDHLGGAPHEVDLEQRKLIRRLEHLGVSIDRYNAPSEFVECATHRLMEALDKAYFSKLGTIFISYSRKDIAYAERIKKLLESLGFQVWLDLVGIAAGEEWPTKIAQAINDSHAVLLLVSEASVSSTYCLKELAFATNRKKPIMGLRLDESVLPDGVELMLGDAQIIGVQNDTVESIIQPLSEGLKTLLRRSRRA